MSGFEIFHTIVFVLIGVMLISEFKGSKKPWNYINLACGILALLIALYDILTKALSLNLF